MAADVSDDFTAATGGELGWFEDGDVAYADYFDALADADAGDLVGPVETDRGSAVLELTAAPRGDRRGAAAWSSCAARASIDERYRDYVRDELLVDAYREHFGDEVVTSPTAQRRVAQILIAPVTGAAVPQERARHVLIKPDPNAREPGRGHRRGVGCCTRRGARGQGRS